MNILFTRSNSLISKTICGLTQEPVSHTALQFGDLVVHSNLLGVRIESLNSFKKHSSIIFQVPRDDSIELITQAVLKAARRNKYDFGALFYIGLRYLFPFLPKKNLWQSSGLYLCTEFVTEVVEEKVDSLITPYQLYLRLRD